MQIYRDTKGDVQECRSVKATPLKQSLNLPCLGVQIYVVDAGTGGQARHLGNVSHHDHNKSSSSRQVHVRNDQLKVGGSTFDLRVASEGHLRLGHADRKVAVALESNS